MLPSKEGKLKDPKIGSVKDKVQRNDEKDASSFNILRFVYSNNSIQY